MAQKIQKLSIRLCDAADNFIKGIGHIVMWGNGILVLVIILQVVLRYGFSHGMVIFEELQWHLYGLGIMIGASYAMVTDSHIRVDIIQARMSRKWKNRWELFGIVFLLLPFAFVIFHQSLDFVHESFRVNESSDAPLGLPFRWMIKGVIPISFALLILAAISRAVRIFNFMREGIPDGNR
ncbi:MAG: TRAP transporter small permease subunit [Deltaproteobacteria bacterium]|nr:TRAP transporter small permease subunit [Deltaproteobacteria bacterium]